MEITDPIYAKNRQEWRSWLHKNSSLRKWVWLVYYKKHTGKPSIPYTDAVEEAICFGWIDGQIKKIDDDKYMQRYTPRTSKSLWSEINVERAEKMINQGMMTEFGLKVFRKGTETKERIPSSKNFSVPDYFKKSLIRNTKAWNNFVNFAPSAKLAYVHWINTAKTEDTRQKRIKTTIQQLVNNKKFGES
jgi:uncharacterized protein YdeI (YjbR/CyaY-like superfamily)